MAGTKVSALPAATVLADADLLPIVDVSDTTQAATGTTKATEASVVATYVVDTKEATTAEARDPTVTGKLIAPAQLHAALPFRVVHATGVEATDDAAINEALADAKTAGGELVQLAAGVFAVDQIILSGFVELKGAGWQGLSSTRGTILKHVTAKSVDMIRFEVDVNGFVECCGITDLQLRGHPSSSAGHGIHSVSAAGAHGRFMDGMTWARLCIRGFAESGIKLWGGSPIRLSDMFINWNGDYGIEIVDDGAGAAIGLAHHIHIERISGDANNGGALISFEGLGGGQGAVSLISIKGERKDDTDHGTSAQQPNVLRFHNCQMPVAIQGITNLAAGVGTTRPGALIVVSGSRMPPSIEYSGAGFRDLDAQTVGDYPVMIDDQVLGIEEPVPPSGSGRYGAPAQLTSPDTALSLPGSSGNFVATLHAAPLAVTGDIDIRVLVALDDWTPAATQYLVNKNLFGSNRSYYLLVNTNGTLTLNGSTLGTTPFGLPSSAATGVSDGTFSWIKAERVAATGVVTYSLATPNVDDMWDDTGVSWSQLGTTVATTSGGIFAGTQPLEVGGNVTNNQNLDGKLVRAVVRDGIGGTIVADYRADNPINPYRDSHGNTWRIGGTGWAWVLA